MKTAGNIKILTVMSCVKSCLLTLTYTYLGMVLNEFETLNFAYSQIFHQQN